MTSLPSEPLQPRFGGVLFNGMPPRASRVALSSASTRDLRTGVAYDIDGRRSGELWVDWNGFDTALDANETSSVESALAALVIQHAMPERVEGLPPLRDGAAGAYMDVLTMLYDVRAFCDESPPRPAPAVSGRGLCGSSAAERLDSKRVLVLLSGGFDSTLALLLLKEAGYAVSALHVRTNRHVEAAEEAAARAIAAALDIPLHEIHLDFPEQEAIGRYYSRSFGEYPFYNSVPHGRDFPLAVIAAVAARRLGCASVAFGHEKESRSKSFPNAGRVIHRHDVESRYGFDLARSFVRASLSTPVEVFSPVAGLSIYRIRRTVLQRYPDLAPLIQSCFWSRRCEKCLKCVSTYTMQRHLGLSTCGFVTNPFSDRDDRDMALFAEPDRPTTQLAYGPQMHFAMAAMVRDGDVGPDDWWLARFAERGLRRVEREWKSIHALCIDADVSPEVPPAVQRVIERMSC